MVSNDVASGLTLLVLLAMLWCLIGIANPRWAHMPSRWFAAAAFGFCWVVEGAITEAVDPVSLKYVTLTFGALWSIVVIPIWLIRRAVQKTAKEKPISRPASPVEALPPKAPAPTPEPAPKPSAPVTPPSGHVFYDHRKAVSKPKARATPKPTSAKAPKRYERRLRESESKKKVLKFTYADEWGEITDRQISPWTEYVTYIHGYCPMRGAKRRFRKDRILEWHDGTKAFLKKP